MNLIVSCDHKVEKYRLSNAVMEARPYVSVRGPTLWYVHHHTFGCSKAYATPEDAVYGMLQGYACFDITVRRAAYRVDTTYFATLAEAKAYAEHAFTTAGIVLSIEDA